ncbi:MAG: polyphosphate kinase 2 [Leptospiraceae bacterium]|nr:polyphosphate kinase 2 [Leptospiraceae bacterium]
MAAKEKDPVDDPAPKSAPNNNEDKDLYRWHYQEPKKRGSIAEDVNPERLPRKFYETELERLQIELVSLQAWIKQQGLRVVVVFEGRDAAGKGGIIKRILQRLNPRVCRVVALGTPTEREKSQWYFQRYVTHLPAAGEMILLDRSWYNRAGVERVMGFCTDAEYEYFMRWVPDFERMIIAAGIKLIKYWISVSDKEQEARFQARIKDPRKQWKLSPMDLQSRARWEEYTKAKDVMLERTEIAESPWFVVKSDDKRRARLNCIAHLLEQFPYETIPFEAMGIPDRQQHSEYIRRPIPLKNMVPEKY